MQATELVRPEAVMISDQYAAGDEQKSAFIRGLSSQHRSCTTKNLMFKIIINKIKKKLHTRDN